MFRVCVLFASSFLYFQRSLEYACKLLMIGFSSPFFLFVCVRVCVCNIACFTYLTLEMKDEI